MTAEPRRCPTHDLALSPSGDCVLCRRASAHPPARETPSSSVGMRALGGIAIVAVAAVIAASGLQGVARQRLDAPIAVAPEPAIAPAPGADPRAEQPRPWQAGAPSDLALDHARRQVAITMYSTSWCGACRAARAYLDDEGIAYRELDVERDRSAAMRMHQLNPRGSVPTIDIEGQVLVGFSSRAIEAAIDAAARRRL